MRCSSGMAQRVAFHRTHFDVVSFELWASIKVGGCEVLLHFNGSHYPGLAYYTKSGVDELSGTAALGHVPAILIVTMALMRVLHTACMTMELLYLNLSRFKE